MSELATSSVVPLSGEGSAQTPPGIAAFLLRALAWIVGLFAFVRIPWVQQNLLIPFARLQHGTVCALTGAPPSDAVTLSCTGADIMAITLGALLSFPLSWRRRLVGAGLGFSLLVALNTIRIGTLLWVVGDPDLFQLLHLRLFPLLLVLAATAFVLFWIRRRDDNADATPVRLWRPVAWVIGCALVYFALAPRLYESGWILTWAFWITAASAKLMTFLGAEATIDGNLLTTANGSWLVTQACVLTPLIPAYFGLVWALGRTLRFKIVASLVAFLLFSALGASRLLVLALPATLLGTGHFVAVHAFYQILLAVVAVVGTYVLLKKNEQSLHLGPAWALAIGLAVGILAQVLERGLLFAHPGTAVADPQGVLSFMPAFTVGLFVAMTLVAGTRSPALSTLVLLSLPLVAGGVRQALGWAAEPGLVLHPFALRLLALLLPVAAAWLLRQPSQRDSYREMWDEVGSEFPDLREASSTATYLRNEQRLILGSGNLKGKIVLKTDLWDEARNTRILQWVAGQGAYTHGVDIALPTVLRARSEFQQADRAATLLVADVRALPYRSDAFDLVYSMGTVEHFPETQKAIAEIGRVTATDGTAIIGVPNRLDPFLRPVLVGIMSALGRYHYGEEKAYSHRALGELCRRGGLRVVGRSGILLQPGILRMLDLALHAGKRNFAGFKKVVEVVLRPFDWAYERFPPLRKHGYLIAAVAKPERPPRKRPA